MQDEVLKENLTVLKTTVIPSPIGHDFLTGNAGKFKICISMKA